MEKRFITIGITLLSVLATVHPANAQTIDLSVSGNGTASENTINTTTNNTTTVNQNNNTDITNNVTTNANTGSNSTSANSGGTAINTGDVNTQTNISNKDINTNHADVSANNQTGTHAVISDNGAKTDNSIKISGNSSTTVTQNNRADITNNVNTNANTGNNRANNNREDTALITGDVNSAINILNKNINNNYTKSSSCDTNCKQENMLKILGNGAGSLNNLYFKFGESTKVRQNNYASILNNIYQNLNTGNNRANFNKEPALVQTGNINAHVGVINENINSNYAEKICNICKKAPEKEVPSKPPKPPVTPPPAPPSPEQITSHVGGPSGPAPLPSPEVLGAAIGQVLPITGNYFMILATLASLIAFFSGWYLRFRSGAAPNYTH